MPKRKRSVESTVQNKLEKYRIDIFRALSSAKAFERKRFSTRLREEDITAEKKARLEREFKVLKALDLRQTARNHLHSNLLKIKAVETSNDLPEELRAGIHRPALSEEEITLQNNVISVLCNTGLARQASDRAVADICETLGVAVPTKSRRVRKPKPQDTEEQASDGELSPPVEGKPKKRTSKPVDEEDESEFEGFESDVDKPRSTIEEADAGEEDSNEEAAFSKYDHLLGGSSDEDDDEFDNAEESEGENVANPNDESAFSKFNLRLGGSSDEEEEFDEALLEKYRGREKVNLDDISLSGSASDVGSDIESPSSSRSSSPQPPKPTQKTKPNVVKEKPKGKRKEELENPKKEEKGKKEKKEKKSKKPAKTTRPGESTFLPSLMGGYISGSESASDIDEPPQKKRRGQRARQAIWEKKYGASAKHLQKQATQGGKDDGWDMRRGAVGADDRGKGKPWGRGGRGQPGRNDHSDAPARGGDRRQVDPKPTKKDDEGTLHPSWEARKAAKEAQKSIAFSGHKVVFD